MNQPAPVDWNPNPMAAPQATAELHAAPALAPEPHTVPAPHGAPAPLAPPAPEGFAMPAGFAAPADPAAALDVTAPLAPIASAPAAMPQVQEGPALDAMPTFAASMEAMPAAAMPAAVEPTAAMPVAAPAETAAVDPTRAWWSPANALVLACAALAWQFISFYARVQLPLVEGSGAQLTYFDRIVGNVPLVDSGVFGPAVGLLLGVGALVMVFAGTRSGLREPVLQGAIGAIAGLALVCTPLLPAVAG